MIAREKFMKLTLSCNLSVFTSVRLLVLWVLETVGVAGMDSGSSFTGWPGIAVNVICKYMMHYHPTLQSCFFITRKWKWHAIVCIKFWLKFESSSQFMFHKIVHPLTGLLERVTTPTDPNCITIQYGPDTSGTFRSLQDQHRHGQWCKND